MRVRAALVVTSLALALGAASAEQAEISFVDQARLGNVFVAGEPVEIRAAVGAGTQVGWTVTDFRKARVASGAAPVADHRATIFPGVTGIGFYEMEIISRDGAAEKGRASTSFAVLAPVDLLPGFDDLEMGPLNPHQVGMHDLPQPLGEQRRPVDGPVLHEPIVDRVDRPHHRLTRQGAL